MDFYPMQKPDINNQGVSKRVCILSSQLLEIFYMLAGKRTFLSLEVEHISMYILIYIHIGFNVLIINMVVSK